MGTLLGHIWPGSAFFIIGAWWTVGITTRRKHLGDANYFNSPTYTLSGEASQHPPVEALVKGTAAIIGGVLELCASTDWHLSHPKVRYWMDIDHVTMFAAFLVSALIDVLMFYRLSCVPKFTDQVALAGAFAVEAFLFYYHSHSGMDSFEVRLHWFLVITILLDVAASAAEIAFQRSYVAAYARAFFTLYQGTWFWQIGLSLYGVDSLGIEPWLTVDNWLALPSNTNVTVLQIARNGEKKKQLEFAKTMVTLSYTWHCLGVFIFVICLIGATQQFLIPCWKLCHKRGQKEYEKVTQVERKPLIISDFSEDESDNLKPNDVDSNEIDILNI